MDFPVEVLVGLKHGKEDRKVLIVDCGKLDAKALDRVATNIESATQEPVDPDAPSFFNEMMNSAGKPKGEPSFSDSILSAVRAPRKSQEEINETKREATKRRHRAWVAREPYKFSRVLSELKVLFPELFGTPKPMIVGIYQEVRQNCEITSRDLHYFFNRYCHSVPYLEAMLKANVRYTLGGLEQTKIMRKEHLLASQQLVHAKEREARNYEEVENHEPV